MMVGRLVSFWEGLFSGAMLNFGRVMISGDSNSLTPFSRAILGGSARGTPEPGDLRSASPSENVGKHVGFWDKMDKFP